MNLKYGHGGDMELFSRISGRPPDEILDFSVNVNPEGIPDFLRGVIISGIANISAYPEQFAETAVRAAAEYHGISPEMIVFGNGTNQIIHCLPRALGIKNAIIFEPAFSEYEKACRAAKVKITMIPGTEKNSFVPELEKLDGLAKPGTAIFLANPGNPAGSAMKCRDILAASKRHCESLFVVDEAFIEYASPECAVTTEGLPENIIIFRSLTKFYGIAGLRAGYAIGNADHIIKIRKQIPEWSVNTFAGAVAVEIFKNGSAFREKTFRLNQERRAKFAEMLSQINDIKVFDSQANYFLLHTGRPSGDVFPKLLRDFGVAVRDCSNFAGLETGGFIRVAVRDDSDNERLAHSLGEILCGSTNKISLNLKKHKPSLMIQGTSSSVGKSILTAAFCRILLDDGYAVAPFKAQNMALNSYVTLDGGEIGRAQAVQAQACKIEPDPRMNPILLKPNSDTGCQVIVMGKAISNMNVSEYFRYKKDIFEKVADAYDSLEKDFDVLVLEGAGSPGEMNLKDGDIVNMRMARYAGSPVLLAGDIDRGGVYASLIGTMDTFEPWERKLVMGFIINKFRGDVSLLAPAHEYVKKFTNRPVLGIVPYIRDIAVPEEDTTRIPFDDISGKDKACLDVALILLGRTSNFTDFAPLAIEPDVNVRLVRKLSDFGNPDLVIIPGSKSVISDLDYLKKSGLADKIIEKTKAGAWLAGICGGLQICGDLIEDPHGIESGQKSAQGLGLVRLKTILEPDKTLVRADKVRTSYGVEISGYEIHHGQTTAGNGVERTMQRQDGTAVGFASGKIWTTYLHGVFDDDVFRRRFIDMIRADRGMKTTGEVRAFYSTENAIKRLSEIVRENVDLEYIYRKMGLK